LRPRSRLFERVANDKDREERKYYHLQNFWKHLDLKYKYLFETKLMPDFIPGIYFTFLNLSGFELTDKVKLLIGP
jgi:hypothetical protein